MKEINLGKSGLFALVSDEDYDYLTQWKWFAKKSKSGIYAGRQEFTGERYENGDRKYTLISMHRVVLNILEKDLLSDHIDRNTLNNQRDNLREATSSQNNKNKSSAKKSSSKYLGVSVKNINKKIKLKDGYKTYHSIKYCSQICLNGKNVEIGQFPYTKKGEIEAAKAYDNFAKTNHKEFANLNFK